MNTATLTKFWLAIIFIQVALVIPIRLIVEWNNEFGQFDTPVARSLNVLFYFTNLSNILVAVICFLLIKNRERTTESFRAAQLTALVCIVVAGTVYWLLLASDDNVVGFDVVTNMVVHTTVPVMFLLAWVFLIEHPSTSRKTIGLSLLFPISWAIVAMLRGALIDWYPYPFMDVRDLGYASALINMAMVTLFFLLLFFLAFYVDSKLGSKAS